MIETFVDEGLGHASYLADLGDGSALVVDPARLPTGQREAAARLGLQIAFSADTHTHADYVSGSPDLAHAGAELLAPAEAGLAVPHRGVRDGDALELGRLRILAIATPGHTPDHLAYLLYDPAGRPVALFSGGSLMVGTVGRTDLMGPELTEPLARQLYRSLHERILTLPDDVALLPTHGAGSFCSAPASAERTSTIGHERETNPLLTTSSEDEFLHLLLGGLGSFPTYFSRLPALNQRGARVYAELPALAPLAADAVEAAVNEGAIVVDVRPIDRFAAGHIGGSLSIALRPVFASWLGWLVEPDRPLVFVIDPDQDHGDLVRQCLTIGFEKLAGYLDGGIDAWRSAGGQTSTIDLLEAATYRGTVLDVRQDEEFAAGHVPGAAHAELGSLPAAPLPGGPVTTMCGHHERAMTGASVLERRGAREVAVMLDGFGGWRDLGHPVTVGS
ncbi:MAG: MBL fold metallo-hydrolase [Actinobacteria bacterium]|nr:MBL fold metallo-hydrolase [Actinomycetota bacterium]